MNINFGPLRILFGWANGNSASELAEIKHQLGELKTIMATNLENILAAIAREKQEVIDAINAALASNPAVSDAAASEIIARINAIVDTPAPATGTFNVTLSKSTTGGTENGQDVTFSNRGVAEAHKDALVAIFDAAVAAAAAATAGGIPLDTTLALTVNGTLRSVRLDNEFATDAADRALLDGFTALLP